VVVIAALIISTTLEAASLQIVYDNATIPFISKINHLPSRKLNRLLWKLVSYKNTTANILNNDIVDHANDFANETAAAYQFDALRNKVVNEGLVAMLLGNIFAFTHSPMAVIRVFKPRNQGDQRIGKRWFIIVQIAYPGFFRILGKYVQVTVDNGPIQSSEQIIRRFWPRFRQFPPRRDQCRQRMTVLTSFGFGQYVLNDVDGFPRNTVFLCKDDIRQRGRSLIERFAYCPVRPKIVIAPEIGAAAVVHIHLKNK